MYSPEEIQVIHQQGLAEPERRYMSLKGFTYVGTSTGRLRLIDNSVLELEIELANTKDELTESINSTKSLQDSVNDIIAVEGGSYVELDFNFDVMPKEGIDQILTLNIIELNTLNGELMPSVAGVQDSLLEVLDSEITIKDF